jgi:tRNA(fMet)-specific endonuclease VapC
MTFLLDTNTCIVAMNDVVGQTRSRLREEAREGRDLFVSAVTVFELFSGAHKSKQQERNFAKMRSFLQLLKQAQLNGEDAEVAGALRAELLLKGQPIGAYDYLIAGQALRRGLTLVTDNEREFRRVAGLKIENWVR